MLRTVRLTGALYFLVEASAPWEIAMPDGAALAPVVLPRAQHVISYHVVTRGACWGRLAGGAPTRLETGDVVVFPHGDPYVMSLDPATGGGPEPAEVLDFMKKMSAGQLPFVIVEGGGGAAPLHLVCGFLGCDVRPFNPLLVGRSLGLLHERPAQAWTLRSLAREVGLSRSTLAERFTHFVGLPRIQYLGRWRMQLAARRLADGDAKVSTVALDVGYDSEAAFSRAFKKAAGMPPAEWRRRYGLPPAPARPSRRKR